ncbi:MAG: bifunctional riboflavin kinase/FAD synthetase [Deltaproteobacteria bacterium]
MKIIKNVEEIPAKLLNPAVTIGNFDGVHLGHREIFRRVKKSAAELVGDSVVITFIPHPLKVLAPDRGFRLITTYEEKERLIEASGVGYLVTIPFTREFAAVSAEAFVRGILLQKIGMKKLIIGYDYAFGRNREGDVTLLRRLGSEYDFTVEMLDQIGNGETSFSSSAVRTLIEDGEVEKVVPFLGRYFSVKGGVVHGLNRGSRLGFPTANIDAVEELLPKEGVYAVKVSYADRNFDGACNIGFNPTFDSRKLTVEVNIFDFDGDLYGKELKVHFVKRVRGDVKFSNVDALKEAIASDVAFCRGVLSGISLLEYHEKG